MVTTILNIIRRSKLLVVISQMKSFFSSSLILSASLNFSTPYLRKYQDFLSSTGKLGLIFKVPDYPYASSKHAASKRNCNKTCDFLIYSTSDLYDRNVLL